MSRQAAGELGSDPHLDAIRGRPAGKANPNYRTAGLHPRAGRVRRSIDGSDDTEIPRRARARPLKRARRVLKSRRSIGVADVEFDDPAGGITELPDSIDLAHKQKVSRTGSGLGAAGMAGTTKGTQISILAFEVANTILKGASVMQSLSEDSVTYFKQVVLPSEGVQNLISSDMGELMRIVANDRREELKVFSQEIVRFGNRCKNPQWHNLDRYFVKLESESVPQKQLKETATVEMQKLMALVQRTTDLYHELHALDRFEQDYRCQLKGSESSNQIEKGDNIQVVKLELKTQRSYVKNLKKRSLWSKTLEQVVEKLVDIVQYLHVEINVSYGTYDGGELSSAVNCQRLGPAGLALHYANTIIQIYSIVSRSGYVPANSRDALYQGLPPRVRLALPNKLRTSSMPREWNLSARGFLRFSEWAKSGSWGDDKRITHKSWPDKSRQKAITICFVFIVARLYRRGNCVCSYQEGLET
uniref:DUF3475 domain-containing protein n=1 Tax=Aegilops tauschii TaxID=37682 RepID=M8CC65_AEGTA